MTARLLACVGLVCALGGSASADSTSIVTLGVGTGVGYLHSYQPGAEVGANTFVNQGNLRLKLFNLIGLDYAVDLGHDGGAAPAGELQFDAKMRLTAISYIVPTPKVSFYIGGGVGGSDTGELLQVMADSNSYHLGAGLEVNLGAHVSVDTSFYMIVPGVRSVERHVEQLALSSTSGSGSVALQGDDEASVGDYVSPKNYELMIRVFLFL